MSIEKKHLVPKLNHVANVAAILVIMKYSMFFYFIVSVIIIVKCCTKIVFIALLETHRCKGLWHWYLITFLFQFIFFIASLKYFPLFWLLQSRWWRWIGNLIIIGFFFLYLSQSGLKFQLFYSLRSSCCNCSV